MLALGRKFWLSVGVVLLQVGMFVFLVLTGKFEPGMILPFLGAPVATFTAFGILNVVASGQTPPAPPTTPGA